MRRGPIGRDHFCNVIRSILPRVANRLLALMTSFRLRPPQNVSFRRPAARFPRLPPRTAWKSGAVAKRGPQHAPLCAGVQEDGESRRRNGRGPRRAGFARWGASGVFTQPKVKEEIRRGFKQAYNRESRRKAMSRNRVLLCVLRAVVVF